MSMRQLFYPESVVSRLFVGRFDETLVIKKIDRVPNIARTQGDLLFPGSEIEPPNRNFHPGVIEEKCIFIRNRHILRG